MKPYTYLIGWTKQNIWYYGAKYGSKADPSKFWVRYFTSSKYVKSARVLYGEPDVIEVRKIFESAKKCKEWETTVLRRIGAVEHNKWLNKTLSNGYPLPIKGIPLRGTGWKHTEETKRKISKGLTGILKPCSEERKDKLKRITREKRYNYNSVKYPFQHINGDTYIGTVADFSETHNLFRTNVYKLIYGQSKSVKGWRLKT